MIFIDQLDKFRDTMRIMIIHEHQFLVSIWFCIWMFYVMLQKFHNYFIKREIIVWWHDVCVWWKIIRKSASHDLLLLNDDHEWGWIIISCIDHFNDLDWFAIFRVDRIILLDAFRHDDFFIFWTVNTNFSLIEIDQITSSNF